MKIAIVGGGIVGLTTAELMHRDSFRNADITILASNFDDTVSHVAAGIFRISPSFCGPTETVTRKWITHSYLFYDTIRKTYDARHAGITDISGYMFANSSPDTVKNHWLESIVPVYRRATEEELQLVNGDWKYGSFYSTLLTQCNLFLPWSRQRLQKAGVTFKQRKLNSLKELTGEYDIIMNCTGFGARKLCDDKRLVSLRGQVLKVKAPWIKMFFYGELDTYVIPGVDGMVTLGGSRNYDSENMKICPHESAGIRERCETLVPSLRNVEIVQQKVGFRPHREGGGRIGEGIRITNTHSKPAILVHNYGHGGYGVSMAPGTAMESIDTVIKLHKATSSKI